MYAFFHRLLHPSEKNDYRARSLHHDFLTGYLLVAIVLSLFFKHIQGFDNILGFATDITTSKLLEYTNQQRSSHGLSTLQYNEKLAAAAEQKASDMFAKNYWAHYSPDGSSPWTFIVSSGYQYEYAGENLAKNFLFSQNVVDAWMNSPSHRENMLRREYTEVGFAVVNGVLNGEETTLVVQMFGKPANSTPIAAVNASENSPPAPIATVAPTSLPTAATTTVPTSPPTPTEARTMAQIPPKPPNR